MSLNGQKYNSAFFLNCHTWLQYRFASDRGDIGRGDSGDDDSEIASFSSRRLSFDQTNGRDDITFSKF